MINISQLTQLTDIDPKLLNAIENGEIQLTDELDFEQLLQNIMDDDLQPFIKAQPKIADEGQSLAAYNLATDFELEANPEIDADLTPEVALPSNLNLAQLISEESTEPLNATQSSEEPFILHDVVIPALHKMAEPAAVRTQLQQPAAVAQQGVMPEQLVVQQPQIKPDEVLHQAQGGQIPDADEPISLKVTPHQSIQDEVVLKPNQGHLDKLELNASLEKMMGEKLSYMQAIGPTTPNKPQTNHKSGALLTVDGTTLTSHHPSSQAKLAMSTPQIQESFQQTMQTPMKLNDTWGKNLNERLILMAKNGFEKALIQIDPPELGPIEVKVMMEGQSANLQFTTHQQSVKDLIENQLNQLKDAFESSGLELLDVNVEHQSESEWAQQSFNQPNAQPMVEVETTSQRQNYDGLLDIYV